MPTFFVHPENSVSSRRRKKFKMTLKGRENLRSKNVNKKPLSSTFNKKKDISENTLCSLLKKVVLNIILIKKSIPKKFLLFVHSKPLVFFYK